MMPPEQVTGFLTSDGKFFKTPTHARRHEATVALTNILDANEMSHDLLSFLRQHDEEIIEYLQAIRYASESELENAGLDPKTK